ncbi:MAG: hypothetical protein JNL11_13815 [Bdellovibrionaceae bacterium]|nr:hypothetical protein [Pseudobdellovibrionaceae bacterium]
MKNLFPASEQISRIKNPLTWTQEKNKLFVEACREMAEFHLAQSPDIQSLYAQKKFHPSHLQTLEDLVHLPSIGVQAMKYFLLLSQPESKSCLRLTSSGTNGQKTQIWFDEGSLQRVQAMLDGLWDQFGLVSTRPTNYLMMVYDPKSAEDLGIAFSIRNQQRFAPKKSEFFALQKNSSTQWEFMIDGCIETLLKYSHEGLPVRICGIPSFIHDLTVAMKAPISLPAGSYILTGGGWKAAEGKKISKEQFRKELSEKLGIPEENIRDGYGMAEHSAPYMECTHHRFHIPVYNRILVRDPETMHALPCGRIGLLELITPFNTMMPNLSVLSTDLGYIDTEPCPCGLTSDTFTLVGRGGLVKHKGCAITAAELTKKET